MTLSRLYRFVCKGSSAHSILLPLAVLAVSGFSFAANAAQAAEFSSWQQACAAAEATVTQGDLIFLDIPHFLFREVAKSTNTWASHVGVVFKDRYGRWIVSESTIPVSRNTPLCKFLRRSAPYKFEIRRFKKPLTESQIARMKAKAQSMLGEFYTFSFDFNSNLLFCSKFVYLVYQSVGVNVGQIETFRQLLHDNPSVSTTFWRFWYWGRIPWNRETITPASELNDPQFSTILRARSALNTLDHNVAPPGGRAKLGKNKPRA